MRSDSIPARFNPKSRSRWWKRQTCVLFQPWTRASRGYNVAARHATTCAACRGARNWLFYLQGSTLTPAPLGVSRLSPWRRIHRLAPSGARLLPRGRGGGGKKFSARRFNYLQVPIKSSASPRTVPSCSRRPARELRLTWHPRPRRLALTPASSGRLSR